MIDFNVLIDLYYCLGLGHNNLLAKIADTVLFHSP